MAVQEGHIANDTIIRSYGIGVIMRIHQGSAHRIQTTGRRTDSGRGGHGGEGIVVMKASRSEAAREAVRADESNLPHARLQGQAPGGRRERPSCGEGDAAGAT